METKYFSKLFDRYLALALHGVLLNLVLKVMYRYVAEYILELGLGLQRLLQLASVRRTY